MRCCKLKVEKGLDVLLAEDSHDIIEHKNARLRYCLRFGICVR